MGIASSVVLTLAVFGGGLATYVAADSRLAEAGGVLIFYATVVLFTAPLQTLTQGMAAQGRYFAGGAIVFTSTIAAFALNALLISNIGFASFIIADLASQVAAICLMVRALKKDRRIV
jgi:hypothetical protein